MKRNKKFFFKIHSWIGVRMGILFFIVCFSGTLATLSHEMDWVFIPESRAGSSSGPRASRNLILANFRERYPGSEMTYWWRPEPPYICDILYKIEDGSASYVFANPYTGEIQGEAPITFQRFFRDLHYYLFIPFQVGHFMVLVFSFLLLISTVTALFFYKRWWRKLFELRTGKGPMVLIRSIHRLVGLWSVPFTLVFSLTGIWYFLERADVGGLGVHVNPPLPTLPSAGSEPSDPAGFDPLTLDYDRAVRIAEAAIHDLEVGSIVPPAGPGSALYLMGTSDVPLVRERSNRIYIDPGTYSLVGLQRAENLDGPTYLNDIADPIHFGYWGGLATKVLWFAFGLGISSLILTGIWIHLKRNALKRMKKNQRFLGFWGYVNWALFGLMLFYMYRALLFRYQASGVTVLWISLGWIAVAGLVWYVFVYRLKRCVASELGTPRKTKQT